MPSPRSFMPALAALLVTAPAYAARAATLVVPTQFKTIQSAVTAAKPGDTVLVKGGTYSEQIIINTPSISIVGTPGTTLDGPNTLATTGFDVEADQVTIQGFTVQHFNIGIEVGAASAANDHITQNLLTKNLFAGADLGLGSTNTDFEYNVAVANAYSVNGFSFTDGVNVDGFGDRVENNLLSNNGFAGVSSGGNSFYSSLPLPPPFDPTIINHVDHNIITGNGYSGVDLNDAAGLILDSNVITGNGLFGVDLFYGTYYCTVSHNLIGQNKQDGVFVSDSVFACTFTNNAVDANGHNGFYVIPTSTGNLFSYDEASGNKNLDAEDDNVRGVNTWTHDQFGTSSPPSLGK